MSILLFPDSKRTEWIAWKKISRKSGGIEPGRFRCTSERFSEFNSTLPSLNISPLHITLRPVLTNKRSSPRPLNSNLLIQLPPFSGSLKSRHTATILPNGKNFAKDTTTRGMSSEFIPRANFLLTRDSVASKINSKRKIKRFLNARNNFKQKLEGIIGVRLLTDSSRKEDC